MSKFSHEAAAADHARAVTIPRPFLRKQPSQKLSSNTPSYLELCVKLILSYHIVLYVTM